MNTHQLIVNFEFCMFELINTSCSSSEKLDKKFKFNLLIVWCCLKLMLEIRIHWRIHLMRYCYLNKSEKNLIVGKKLHNSFMTSSFSPSGGSWGSSRNANAANCRFVVVQGPLVFSYEDYTEIRNKQPVHSVGSIHLRTCLFQFKLGEPISPIILFLVQGEFSNELLSLWGNSRKSRSS